MTNIIDFSQFDDPVFFEEFYNGLQSAETPNPVVMNPTSHLDSASSSSILTYSSTHDSNSQGDSLDGLNQPDEQAKECGLSALDEASKAGNLSDGVSPIIPLMRHKGNLANISLNNVNGHNSAKDGDFLENFPSNDEMQRLLERTVQAERRFQECERELAETQQELVNLTQTKRNLASENIELKNQNKLVQQLSTDNECLQQSLKQHVDLIKDNHVKIKEYDELQRKLGKYMVENIKKEKINSELNQKIKNLCSKSKSGLKQKYIESEEKCEQLRQEVIELQQYKECKERCEQLEKENEQLKKKKDCKGCQNLEGLLQVATERINQLQSEIPQMKTLNQETMNDVMFQLEVVKNENEILASNASKADQAKNIAEIASLEHLRKCDAYCAQLKNYEKEIVTLKQELEKNLKYKEEVERNREGMENIRKIFSSGCEFIDAFSQGCKRPFPEEATSNENLSGNEPKEYSGGDPPAKKAKCDSDEASVLIQPETNQDESICNLTTNPIRCFSQSYVNPEIERRFSETREFIEEVFLNPVCPLPASPLKGWKNEITPRRSERIKKLNPIAFVPEQDSSPKRKFSAFDEKELPWNRIQVSPPLFKEVSLHNGFVEEHADDRISFPKCSQTTGVEEPEYPSNLDEAPRINHGSIEESSRVEELDLLANSDKASRTNGIVEESSNDEEIEHSTNIEEPRDQPSSHEESFTMNQVIEEPNIDQESSPQKHNKKHRTSISELEHPSDAEEHPLEDKKNHPPLDVEKNQEPLIHIEGDARRIGEEHQDLQTDTEYQNVRVNSVIKQTMCIEDERHLPNNAQELESNFNSHKEESDEVSESHNNVIVNGWMPSDSQHEHSLGITTASSPLVDHHQETPVVERSKSPDFKTDDDSKSTITEETSHLIITESGVTHLDEISPQHNMSHSETKLHVNLTKPCSSESDSKKANNPSPSRSQKQKRNKKKNSILERKKKLKQNRRKSSPPRELTPDMHLPNILKQLNYMLKCKLVSFGHQLSNVLLNPTFVPTSDFAINTVINYLLTSRNNPLAAFAEELNADVLLPLSEKCIVEALFAVDKKKKIRLQSLLRDLVARLKEQILENEAIDPNAHSAMCRVFAYIAKKNASLGDAQLLCHRLLSSEHPCAFPAVAAIASLWSDILFTSSSPQCLKDAWHIVLLNPPPHLSETAFKHCWNIFHKICEMPEVPPSPSSAGDLFLVMANMAKEGKAMNLSDLLPYKQVIELILPSKDWAWVYDNLLSQLEDAFYDFENMEMKFSLFTLITFAEIIGLIDSLLCPIEKYSLLSLLKTNQKNLLESDIGPQDENGFTAKQYILFHLGSMYKKRNEKFPEDWIVWLITNRDYLMPDLLEAFSTMIQDSLDSPDSEKEYQSPCESPYSENEF